MMLGGKVTSFPPVTIVTLLDPHTYSIETREQRVDSWRSFANTSKKKKKGKGDVLG
jgi:hypothetical protein